MSVQTVGEVSGEIILDNGDAYPFVARITDDDGHVTDVDFIYKSWDDDHPHERALTARARVKARMLWFKYTG